MRGFPNKTELLKKTTTMEDNTVLNPTTEQISLDDNSVVGGQRSASGASAQPQGLCCNPPDAVIIAFVELIESNGIAQHTPAWEAIRSFLVGGSSVAYFAGGSIGPLTEFMSSKLQLGRAKNYGKYDKCTYLQWGNIFEPLIEKYVEIDLRTVVRGTNIFVKGHEQGGVLYTAYSPDGLAAVDGKVTLLEFKCPFARMPAGRVPAQYVPQVKMGLDTIPIAETGLFVDAVFRKCARADLNFEPTYDKSMKQEVAGDGAPLAIGIIYFAVDIVKRAAEVAKLKTARKHAAAKALMMDTSAMLDLGACSSEIFEQFMVCYNAGIMLPTYSPVFTTPQIDFGPVAAEFDGHCTSHGYDKGFVLCWKLFQVKYFIVDRQPGYMAPLLPNIITAMDTLRAADGLSDMERKKIYQTWADAAFPHSIMRIADEDVVIE
jgi:hypothetical protein